MPMLDDLMYSNDRVGPWRLYIYEIGSPYHRGGQWFSKQIKYADEEILVAEAGKRAFAAIAEGREVRVTDSGDNLVFHSLGGRVEYGASFWDEIS